MGSGDGEPVIRRRRIGDLFGIDVRALAAMRIGLGIVLLLDLADRARMLHLDTAYPLSRARAYLPLQTSLHLVSDHIVYQGALFALAALAALLFLVGYRTRIATAILWYLMLSLFHRNIYVHDVGDAVSILILFWGLFLPLGSCWSLDARLRGARFGRVRSMVSAALLLQVASVYFFATQFKLKGEGWRSGLAVQQTLSDDVWVRPFGELLLQYPELMTLLTYGTLAVEGLAPIALFLPVGTPWLRVAGVVALAGFNAGIGSAVNLGFIPWVMSLGLLPFLPTGFWDALERVVGPARAPERGVATEGIATGSWPVQVLAGLVTAFVLVLNVDAVTLGRVPNPVRGIAHSVGFNQNWSMYAPEVGDGNFRLSLEGELEDGQSLELVVGSEREGWPNGSGFAPLEELWASYRGRSLIEYIQPQSQWVDLHAFLRWTCRQWNAAHPEQRLVALGAKRQMRRPLDGTEKPGEIREIVYTRPLVRHGCP